MNLKFTHLLAAMALGGLMANADEITVDGWTLTTAPFGTDGGVNIVSATGSGALDLTKVTDVKIVNIEPTAFRGNTGLTTITIPVSLQSTEYTQPRLIYSNTFSGDGSNRAVPVTPPVAEGASFTIRAKITLADYATTDNKNSYMPNAWGCAILASGNNPVGGVSVWQSNFQIYLNTTTNNGGKLMLVASSTASNPSVNNGVDMAEGLVPLRDCGGTINLEVDYDATTKTFTSTYSDANGHTASKTLQKVNLGTIDFLSANPGNGITEELEIYTVGGDAASPFAGCTSLTEIIVPEGNTVYSIGDMGALLKHGMIAAFPLGSLYDKYVRFSSGTTGTDYNMVTTGIINAAGKIDTSKSRDLTRSTNKTGTSIFEITKDEAGDRYIYGVNTMFNEGTVDPNVSYGACSKGYLCIDNSGVPMLTFKKEWAAKVTMAMVSGFSKPYFTIKLADSKYIAINNAKTGYTLKDAIDESCYFTVSFARTIEIANPGTYTTFCLPVAVKTPENACYVSSVENNDVKLTKFDATVLPAGTPFIVHSEDGTESLVMEIVDGDVATASARETINTGLLKGTVISTDAATANLTYLYDTSFGNFKNGNTNVAANTAYIFNSTGDTWADELTVNTSDTEAISEITAAGANAAAAVYDLQGRRLAAPVKGINIINGRKVLVK